MADRTKTIAYSCPYVPAEWIAAHGLRPQRVIPLPVEGPDTIARAEGLCPYARAFVNDVIAGREAAGVIVTTRCDQMRRVFDLLVRRTELPAFLLNVPSTWQTAAAQRLYFDELKRLSRFLVRLGGRTPSDRELAKTMIEGAAIRVEGILPSGVADVSAAIRRRDAFGTRGQDAHDTNGLHSTPGVPIAVVGGPLMQRDRILFEVVEDCGGRIVLDATETGQRGRRASFDRRALAENPLMELARVYFSIPDASRRPNSGLYRWLEGELAKAGARGIIFHHYVWCDTWRAEFARLREWAGLPVLQLDSDGPGEMSKSRLQNRIRAFLEMLQ